uniref:Uncharacterized protein n=1 Tax=Oryza brachyantha TaxID=4533 RepID=J3KU50_ORYBR
MDKDCFNMAIRMLACNEFLMFLDDTIHYIDLQFWTISDFHREPRRHAKLDIRRLAKLFECWPGMEYKISQCSNVTISDFHCEPCRHAKLDVKRLAKLFECWPGMEYKISQCSNVSKFIWFFDCFVMFLLYFFCRFYCRIHSSATSHYLY